MPHLNATVSRRTPRRRLQRLAAAETHHQDLFVHVNPLLPNYEKIRVRGEEREGERGSQVSSL